MNIYELYGRLAEQHENECAAHRQTVGVLAQLKSGKLTLDQVEVDEANLKWATFPARAAPVDKPAEQESK